MIPSSEQKYKIYMRLSQACLDIININLDLELLHNKKYFSHGIYIRYLFLEMVVHT